jgi:hypothetical protein
MADDFACHRTNACRTMVPRSSIVHTTAIPVLARGPVRICLKRRVSNGSYSSGRSSPTRKYLNLSGLMIDATRRDCVNKRLTVLSSPKYQ